IIFTPTSSTMIPTLATIAALATLVTASPMKRGPVIPNYPTTSTSQGFHLVVNVTNPELDFESPINNFYINSIHVGAGLNLVGVSDYPGRIFYQNGTAEDIRYGRGTIISDAGTVPLPYGISLTADDESEELFTARMNAGFGTPGLSLSRFPEPYVFVLFEQYVACDEALDYYHGKHFVIIKRIPYGGSMPDNCIPVRLLPQCTKLNALPEGSWSSHEFAANSACYDDVSALEWTKYGPY
ncbi:hypothetical protein B0I35DRAFT_357321, partial [Stachybotrys elegans]